MLHCMVVRNMISIKINIKDGSQDIKSKLIAPLYGCDT